MWFKNLTLYRFTESFSLSPEQLELSLAQHIYRPCGSIELSVAGWHSPYRQDDKPLVHVSGSAMLISMLTEDKILPASVINEHLDERIQEIETQTGRRPGKKERAELRDEIMHTLLPRAFTNRRRIYACIDPTSGWLVVDSPSAKRAEALNSLLRGSLGSLPVVPLRTNARPASILTDWISDTNLPADLVIDDACELKDYAEEGAIVRCRKQDLSAPEIQNHLQAGKEVSRLAMTWRERISYTLDDTLSLKGLRFLDGVQELIAEMDVDDELARFDADFLIMHQELSQLLPCLLDWFAGEATGKASDPFSGG